MANQDTTREPLALTGIVLLLVLVLATASLGLHVQSMTPAKDHIDPLAKQHIRALTKDHIDPLAKQHI
jgi:hypothetical protein